MHTIIPAVPADAAIIHEIQMRAFAEEARLSDNAQIPELTEPDFAIDLQIRTQTVLVALDGDRIVGSARGIFNGASCIVCSVSVEPHYQRRGVGTSLLRGIEQAHPAVERFELETNTLVPGNVAFYEHHGYQVTELTTRTDKTVRAQMVKTATAADA